MLHRVIRRLRGLTDIRWLLPLMAIALVPGILLGRIAPSVSGGWYALLCSAAALVLLPKKLRPAACFAAFAAVGLIAGWHGYHPVTPPVGEYTVDAILCDEAVMDENGHLVTRLTDVRLNGIPSADAYWSCYPQEDPCLAPG